MSRPKGLKNKPKQPVALLMSEQERLELIANIILDIVTEELNKKTPKEPCTAT